MDDPTLEDMLSDSAVKAVMEADRVDPAELRAMALQVARKRVVTGWVSSAADRNVER